MTPNLLHIRIHSFTGATLACRIMGTTPFVLHGPENCGETHGAKWFAALLAKLRNDWPACQISGAIDCRTHTGQALSALESGIEHVIIGDINPAARASLQDIAGQKGCHIWVQTVFAPSDPCANDALVLCAMPFHDIDDHFLPGPELEKRLRTTLAQL
ncbi:hypothetical protein [Thalassospira mesophila]|uniref:Uncharacterized protein n=1 Tax=Thalassospira mesophila TaxID=1293891 RepID=A0A1Y2L1A1_9PROT|nr:hypothetical protein [Thalassospira mesophila]OSQ38744.1 hypothetical protein TMES_08030 [Thalassospira mesophila]